MPRWHMRMRRRSILIWKATLLEEIFDGFISPKLAKRLPFGEPRKGNLFSSEDV